MASHVNLLILLFSRCLKQNSQYIISSAFDLFLCSNGYNILLHGLGSKRTLMDDFRKSELKDLDHVVVNGYFPSLTIKHVSP